MPPGSLADLLDRANHVFSLAAELARTFQQERNREGGGILHVDPHSWTRHQPDTVEFNVRVCDLQSAILNPPDGFAPVAEVLREAARVARCIRDLMQTEHGRRGAGYLNYYPELNSVAVAGRGVAAEARKARRLDDRFAFLNQPTTVQIPKESGQSAGANKEGEPAHLPNETKQGEGEKPKPAATTEAILPALLSASDIAKRIGRKRESVTSFLTRLAARNPDCRIKNEAKRKNEPGYLYRTNDVWPALEKWLKDNPAE